MWGHMVFLFPKWFLSQMIKPSKSIHLSQIAGKDFIILSLINTPVCVCLFNYMSHICSFFFWRTLILLPYVDYCIEWCRKKSVCIYHFKRVFLFSSGKYAEVELLDLIDVLFSVLVSGGENCTVFHSGHSKFQLQQRCLMIPCLHILTSTHYSSLFYDNHSNRCEVISQFAVDLHFPEDEWYWESFQVCVSHCMSPLIKVYLGTRTVFNWVVCFFVLEFLFYWSIVDLQCLLISRVQQSNSVIFLLFSRYVVSDSFYLTNCTMPGSSVLLYLRKFAQICVHWVGDAI